MCLALGESWSQRSFPYIHPLWIPTPRAAHSLYFRTFQAQTGLLAASCSRAGCPG